MRLSSRQELTRVRLSRNDTASRRYLEREDRRRNLRLQIPFLATLAVGTVYLCWAYPKVNWEAPWMAGAFMAAEIACLGFVLVSGAKLSKLLKDPRSGVAPARPHSVDVLVTVSGEPIELIGRTLSAAREIRWDGSLHKFVLDDSGSDEVRQLAFLSGFEYLSRLESGGILKDGRAGNLNFGLEHSTGDLVLTLDADQAPAPEILEVMTGYMCSQKVAFVQSRQAFDVSDDDPFFDSDPLFNQRVQQGFDDFDAAISCGSGVLYRREALEDIGGFTTWNDGENLTTSYELHSRGWKSLYHPVPLTVGVAPNDLEGVYRQRGQWALDAMRLFFWDSPLWKRGLMLRRRLGYLMVAYSHFCAAFVFPYFFLLPIWSYASGSALIVGDEIQFATFRTLYFVAMALVLSRPFGSQRPTRRYGFLSGLFPVYLSGIVKALTHPPGRTPVQRGINIGRPPTPKLTSVKLLAPQLGILAANIALPLYGVLGGTTALTLIWVNIPFSALAIWSLSQIVVAGLGRKTYPRRTVCVTN